jgi:heme-degrading monooxygenase HmoA
MHVILWRFLVKSGCEADFERAYGPEGDWARLFRRGEGYLGAELLRENSRENSEHASYVTIDRWLSQAAYTTFSDQFQDEYRTLDQRFEALTEQEIPLGSFSSLAAPVAE